MSRMARVGRCFFTGFSRVDFTHSSGDWLRIDIGGVNFLDINLTQQGFRFLTATNGREAIYETRLERVLSNLISNAIRHTPTGV